MRRVALSSALLPVVSSSFIALINKKHMPPLPTHNCPCQPLPRRSRVCSFDGYLMLTLCHTAVFRRICRRVLCDVERGRTVRGWLPRRLGERAASAEAQTGGAASAWFIGCLTVSYRVAPTHVFLLISSPRALSVSFLSAFLNLRSHFCRRRPGRHPGCQGDAQTRPYSGADLPTDW